jgi:hypothetical protein
MGKVEGVNVRKEKKKKKSFCLKITPCDFLAHHPLIISLEKKKFENCNLHDNYYISSHKQTCATNLGENPTIELILLLSSHDREIK